MNNKIGFIAVGQAGGNIGSKLEAVGYDVLFLNTSDEDLSTLETKFKYHIKGGEGCNKDRNKAKELVIGDFESIAKEIVEKVNKDFIYVIFSSGGGTGSGASPMLIDVLIQHMDKAVGAITIIPGENEPLKTHINAYECFREIEGIDGMASTIVLDNNACENKFSINKSFVDSLQGLMDMPNYKDIRGNIDKAEVMELISARGMLVVTQTDKTEANLSNIVEGIKKNIYAPIESDKVIKYLGLLAAKPVDISELKKEVGSYIDAFQGYGDETICVLSGLSFPFTRLNAIKQKVIDNQEIIQRNLQATSETRLNSNINFLDGFIPQTKKPKVGGAADIFAKYKKK